MNSLLRRTVRGIKRRFFVVTNSFVLIVENKDAR